MGCIIINPGEVWLDADEPDCNKDTIMYDSSYDSKMHEVIIPLMGFNGFHHASSTDSKEEFEDFIGRESIIDKLKGWLYDAREDNRRHKTKYSGAYLITGFRGMGKSSFVHKAIHEIQTKKLTKKKYVPISINVGNDLLTSRELLYIICRLLNKSYDENTRIDTKLTANSLYHKTLYFIKRLLRFIKNVFTFRWKEAWRSIDYLLCSNSIQLVRLALFGLMFYLFTSSHGKVTLIQGIEQLLESFIGIVSYLYHFIVYKWLGLYKTSVENCNLSYLGELFQFKDVLFFIALFTCCFIRRIFFFCYELTGSSIFITKWQIRRNFKHILQRIESDTTITTQNGVDGQVESKMDTESVKWGFQRFKNKKIFYPIAQTTEIQDLLVDQLSLINRMPSSNLRFIFIIDELDKVSPEDLETQTIPEFEYTNSVKGNSTYRSRQKALAELLANLKYFISSSEAKFIFITGYDMYETTLSDISSREFNIHSIFNGYINVSSFLRKTGKDSGADSMIEEYLCHMLLSKNFKKKTNNCKDLSLYAKAVREKWDTSINKYFDDNDRPLFEMLLERRINFLRHFLTYLFYMSNGSPKKLAMYLEKYIRSKDRVEEQINLRHYGTKKEEIKQLSLGAKDCWDKCNWFLFFDARNMQKIEFVNYLIYPMIKNLIAKSSIYNDKLLVATSFMISNLYKFHKSGFSWRNLEYMPELLEINKMPELRDFIGGIMQFLNQTHIDEATINLYRFKFPQRLSEEITYFSKSSEEVSFLFNFSHDELLSIKKLYQQQLKHYKGMQNEAPAIASIHHALGDIYMLEENYEQAIYEFNEALNAVLRQDEASQSNMEDATNVLFRIRVSLKLALAYEKRKTFDTAYNTYLNIEKLILAIVNAPRDYFGSQINDELRSNSSFFTNVRISILCVLAKVAVLEKMGMGGIRIKDLEVLNNEFNCIQRWLCNDEIRPVLIIEFYKKLGDILYYKNGVFAHEILTRGKFNEVVELFRNQLGLGAHLKDKFKYCKVFIVDQQKKGEKTINPPCIACQCFNKSISACLEELNGDSEKYTDESRSLFFIDLLFKVEGCQDVMRKGNVFMLTMANLLVGMGNTLLGCIKEDAADVTIQNFFLTLEGFFHKGYSDVSFDAIEQLKHANVMNPYSKAILYYLAAARTYELLTDYKLAYNIYIQILDAVFAYSCAVSDDIIDKYSLRFCEVITEQAITCTYLHYDCINCEEIDTLKHEMGRKQSENINLHNLSSFPEIEVVTEKYYRLCMLGKTDVRNQTLKNVINSRQLGQHKLIATLTQNIQNMYFKVIVNDELLSMMIPNVSKAFSGYHHSLINTLEYFSEYYNKFNLKNLIDELEWKIVKNDYPTKTDKMEVLYYLVNDTLFCLNKITELIAPLFSTTLYSNAYIGLIYEKIFNWSHLWITLREISEYLEIQDKDKYIEKFKERYPPKNDEYYVRLVKWFDSFGDLQLNIYRNDNNKDKNNDFHAHEINFLTGSYLTGNAIDFFNRAVEMHTSGKAYKEMMPTLFFLEDDLNNDSNYLNLAIERFLLNHGYVQKKMENLKKYSFAKSSLLRSDNYYKP